MRVFYVTAYWPTEETPWSAPFIARQVDFLRRAGLDVEVFHFRGYRNLANYVRIYRRLHACLRRERYDVIHAQFGHSGFLAGLPKRAPLVVTFQGSDLEGIYGPHGHYELISYPLRLAMQLVAYLADEVIVVSQRLGRLLWRKDYHVLPGGVDLDLFRPLDQRVARERLRLPLDKKLILFVGAPEKPVKRYPLACEVVRVLDPSLDAELVVASGIPPHQMPLYMNAADALLVTSKHEGSPNTVKEALACNLPIVSVDVGDVRERLEGVANCVVVPSDEATVIAQHLTDILRSGLRSNGREAARALDEAQLAKQHIAIYESAIRKYRGERTKR